MFGADLVEVEPGDLATVIDVKGFGFRSTGQVDDGERALVVDEAVSAVAVDIGPGDLAVVVDCLGCRQAAPGGLMVVSFPSLKMNPFAVARVP